MLASFLNSLLVLIVFYGVALADTAAERLLQKPDSWFNSEDGRQSLEAILSWQTDNGDWPKNQDTTQQKSEVREKQPAGTFDNGATISELRVLARAIRVAADEKYLQAFQLGFDHIIAAQYANGGWPQYYPLSKKYHRHITFNDGTMIRIMEFLQDCSREQEFAFLDATRRHAAQLAVERGVECILKCQIICNGKLTVWCAQHDADTLAPVHARAFELVSLSGSESAGILRFLMRLDTPSTKTIEAVKAGVAWFEAVKIQGVRYRRSQTLPALTEDSQAPSLWARFYEIESNRPIFCDRDGVAKYSIDEIGSERRNGYTWYGNWGDKLFKDYAKWSHR